MRFNLKRNTKTDVCLFIALFFQPRTGLCGCMQTLQILFLTQSTISKTAENVIILKKSHRARRKDRKEINKQGKNKHEVVWS